MAHKNRVVYCVLVINAFKVDPVMTFETDASPGHCCSQGGQGGQGGDRFGG